MIGDLPFCSPLLLLGLGEGSLADVAGRRYADPGEEKMPLPKFNTILYQEQDLYVAEYPEIGMVSQGMTAEEALANLKEATELYLEEFPASLPILSQ